MLLIRIRCGTIIGSFQPCLDLLNLLCSILDDFGANSILVDASENLLQVLGQLQIVLDTIISTEGRGNLVDQPRDMTAEVICSDTYTISRASFRNYLIDLTDTDDTNSAKTDYDGIDYDKSDDTDYDYDGFDDSYETNYDGYDDDGLDDAQRAQRIR